MIFIVVCILLILKKWYKLNKGLKLYMSGMFSLVKVVQIKSGMFSENCTG